MYRLSVLLTWRHKEIEECLNILKLGEEHTASVDVDSGIAIFRNGSKMTCKSLKEFWKNKKEFRQMLKDYDTEAAANELTGDNQLTNESTVNPDYRDVPLVMICLQPDLVGRDVGDKWPCRFFAKDEIDLSNIDITNEFKKENTFNYGE